MKNQENGNQMQKFYGLLMKNDADEDQVYFISEKTFETLRMYSCRDTFCLEAKSKDEVTVEAAYNAKMKECNYKGLDLYDLTTFDDWHFIEVYGQDCFKKIRPISLDEYTSKKRDNMAVFQVKAGCYSLIHADTLIEEAEKLHLIVAKD